jgi:hypothetical protein
LAGTEGVIPVTVWAFTINVCLFTGSVSPFNIIGCLYVFTWECLTSFVVYLSALVSRFMRLVPRLPSMVVDLFLLFWRLFLP